MVGMAGSRSGGKTTGDEMRAAGLFLVHWIAAFAVWGPRTLRSQPGAGEHFVGDLAVLPLPVVEAALECAVLDDDLAAQDCQAGPRLDLAAFPRRVIRLMQLRCRDDPLVGLIEQRDVRVRASSQRALAPIQPHRLSRVPRYHVDLLGPQVTPI